jgi:hypothetical protein
MGIRTEIVCDRCQEEIAPEHTENGLNYTTFSLSLYPTCDEPGLYVSLVFHRQCAVQWIEEVAETYAADVRREPKLYTPAGSFGLGTQMVTGLGQLGRHP